MADGSIPVIIHLLNRRRFRIVNWGAMRFLLAAQRRNARRMRLEQFILLAMRVALVLLLVLAMASVSSWATDAWLWLFPGNTAHAGTANQRTHTILVIDGSLSMATRITGPAPSPQPLSPAAGERGNSSPLSPAAGERGRGEGAETCFSKAQRLAEEIVRGGGNDAFSVILMAAPPRRIVSEPSEDRDKVAREIKAMRMPHGNADLAATLNSIEGLLHQSPGKFDRKEVYIFTDMQQSTWITRQPDNLARSLEKIQGLAHTVLVDVGQDDVGNLAVTDLTLAAPLASTTADTPITATIHNYSPDTREHVRVQLLVGKARTAASEPPCALQLVQARDDVKLTRGQNTISFSHKFSTPGDYVVQVCLPDHDALDLDDVRSAVVTVRNEVPVLLVNGKPHKDLYEQGTEYLFDALNPYQLTPGAGQQSGPAKEDARLAVRRRRPGRPDALRLRLPLRRAAPEHSGDSPAGSASAPRRRGRFLSGGQRRQEPGCLQRLALSGRQGHPPRQVDRQAGSAGELLLPFSGRRQGLSATSARSVQRRSKSASVYRLLVSISTFVPS